MFDNNTVQAIQEMSDEKMSFTEGERNYLMEDIRDRKSRQELENTEEKIGKLKLLIEINSYITMSLEGEEVQKRILQQTKKIFHCESSSILMVDKDLNRLKFAFLSKDEEDEILMDTSLKMGEGIAGTVWSNGVPIMINDAQNDPRFSDVADKKSKTLTRSLIAAPLIVNGEIIGVIEAINKKNSCFTAFDLEILQYISTQSAIAIKNAGLYNMAIRDGMTKLYINKYFKERLLEELNRSRRYNHKLSLVMFDIDHFKSFNDTYGHQAGDLVLREVARIIQENCRSIDIPCRYGGEEFAVILPETSSEEAMIFMERIRDKIEQMRISHNTHTLNLTISGGLASIPELDPVDINEIIEMSDKALYHSKENGRNQVHFYNPEKMKIQC